MVASGLTATSPDPIVFMPQKAEEVGSLTPQGAHLSPRPLTRRLRMTLALSAAPRDDADPLMIDEYGFFDRTMTADEQPPVLVRSSRFRLGVLFAIGFVAFLGLEVGVLLALWSS